MDARPHQRQIVLNQTLQSGADSVLNQKEKQAATIRNTAARFFAADGNDGLDGLDQLKV